MIKSSVRTISDTYGEISYTLEYKNVKRVNLRINSNGKVFVSVAPNVPAELVDKLVENNLDYIRKSLNKFNNSKGNDSPKTKDPKLGKIKCKYGEIIYILQRKKIHNLHLRVRNDGVVTVSAPMTTEISKIETFIIENVEFIHKTQLSHQKRNKRTPRPLEYITGEKVCFLGDIYTLKVVESNKNQVTKKDKKLILEVENIGCLAFKKNVFNIFLDNQLYEVIQSYLDRYLPFFSEACNGRPIIKLKDKQQAYGTCYYNKGLITFSRGLVVAPIECIEYIVLHEMSHFIVHDHSEAFTHILDLLMKDWKKREKLLNQYAV